VTLQETDHEVDHIQAYASLVTTAPVINGEEDAAVCVRVRTQ
jgi:hypothetical protein